MLQLSSKELRGKNAEEVLDLSQRDQHAGLAHELILRAYNQKEIVSVRDELFIERHTGGAIPVIMIISPAVNAGTRVVEGAIITLRDQSDQHLLNQARDFFLFETSKQLLAPIIQLHKQTEALLRTMQAQAMQIPEQHDAVKIMHQALIRLNRVLNLLFHISLIEATSFQAATEPVNIAELTNEVIGEILHKFPPKHIINIHADDNLPILTTDRSIVKDAIEHLLVNAWQYSPSKTEILVTIRVRASRLEYSIEDQGIGIPTHDQPHIFEKFFRAENAVTTVADGTGVSLALVKYGLEKLGGSIWFLSREGIGSIFSFSLPLAPPACSS